MPRSKTIRVRSDDGTLYVILEISGKLPGDESTYELPNRARVTRMSDTEFVVIETGQVLTRV